jgi:hypothetical protein
LVVSKILDQSSISVKIKKVQTILMYSSFLGFFYSRPVLFGEEKGGIASKASFLSSGKRGASRTENKYKKNQENYTRKTGY